MCFCSLYILFKVLKLLYEMVHNKANLALTLNYTILLYILKILSCTSLSSEKLYIGYYVAYFNKLNRNITLKIIISLKHNFY